MLASDNERKRKRVKWGKDCPSWQTLGCGVVMKTLEKGGEGWLREGKLGEEKEGKTIEIKNNRKETEE